VKAQPKSANRVQSQLREYNIRKSLNAKQSVNQGSIAKVVERLASKDSRKRDKENIPSSVQQVLTKEMEDKLIEGARDKLMECMKCSNTIHELLETNNIEKSVMLDMLY
jgi:response regulator of citrate/malate metabolism